MSNPKKTKNGWINLIKRMSFIQVIIMIFVTYLILITLFGCAYYLIELKYPILDSDGNSSIIYSIFDSIYFSSVTFFTVGFGDISLTSLYGKLLVQIEMIISSLTVAISIAILTAKLFYPGKTVIFSDKIVISKEEGILSFRVINIHRATLINPEIKVFLIGHCSGNVIAPSMSLAHITDLPMLGIHDYTCSIRLEKFKNIFNEQLSLAQQFNKDLKLGEDDSRFRITISITGHNGIQQISEIHKYYADNFYEGKSFKAIKYNEYDQSKRINLSYKHFDKFWETFNEVVNN